MARDRVRRTRPTQATIMEEPTAPSAPQNIPIVSAAAIPSRAKRPCRPPAADRESVLAARALRSAAAKAPGARCMMKGERESTRRRTGGGGRRGRPGSQQSRPPIRGERAAGARPTPALTPRLPPPMMPTPPHPSQRRAPPPNAEWLDPILWPSWSGAALRPSDNSEACSNRSTDATVSDSEVQPLGAVPLITFTATKQTHFSRIRNAAEIVLSATRLGEMGRGPRAEGEDRVW